MTGLHQHDFVKWGDRQYVCDVCGAASVDGIHPTDDTGQPNAIQQLRKWGPGDYTRDWQPERTAEFDAALSAVDYLYRDMQTIAIPGPRPRQFRSDLEYVIYLQGIARRAVARVEGNQTNEGS